ncbi:MAG: 1,4-dihydroxy-2-naphthoate octaprenyltransferase [Acidilobaceae archaeon]|jgi:1,4-dihydroxy-2-naphthoate octaprenyltransferase
MIAKILLSVRPWSFTMIAGVVISAITLAFYYGYPVDITLALLALVGAVLLQAFVNWFNDYGDYVMGVDRVGVGTTIYRPHLLVEGALGTRQILVLSFSSAAISIAIGLYIAFNGRPLVIPIGVAGFLLGLLYSIPRVGFKYNALGELAVFLAFGPLMFLGSFYAATGLLDLRALIASAPLGMLITAVLLANNIRDIETDSRSGIKTLATTLGLKRSTVVYLTLLLGPIAYTLALVALRVLPVTSAITVLVLPLAIRLTRISLSGRIPADFDPMTARVVLLYSMLLIASLLVAVLLK